jgi:hypothetical protein
MFQAIKSLFSSRRLCDRCREIKHALSIGNSVHRIFDNGRNGEISLGSVEDVCKRDFCYCCRAINRLISQPEHPRPGLLCFSFIYNTGTRIWEAQIGYDIRDSPDTEYERYHNRWNKTRHYQYNHSRKIILVPLTPKIGKESQARTYRSDRLNIDLIRQWIRECDECYQSKCPKYSPSCSQLGLSTLTHIYLVDLEKECVVTTRFNSRYVALSYV